VLEAVIMAFSADGQDASEVAGSVAVSGIKVGAEREGEVVSGRRRLVAVRQANVERRSGSVHKKSFTVERVNISEGFLYFR
jgi:hypothetical protein